MDTPPEEDTEIQRQGEIFSLKNNIADVLNLTPTSIDLKNADDYLDGKSRYLYGFTEPELTDSSTERLTPGFFKVAKDPQEIKKLQRESTATTVARAIGIAEVEVLNPYQDIPDGQGIVHLESLNSEDGIFFTKTLSPISAADPIYGARFAKAYIGMGELVVPTNIDSALLRRDEPKNISLETFLRRYAEFEAIIFDKENKNLLDKLIGEEDLSTIIDEAKLTVEPYIVAAQDPDREFFVHGDMDLYNAFFYTNGDIKLIDFEYSGATHNSFLAKLSDVGNFYGRLWSNTEMQQGFLTTYLESSSNSLDHTYQLLKACVVFGSIGLAKYAMSPDHPEHDMTVALLGSIKGNLELLDQKYNEMKKTQT